jgi:hypothetical protein
VAYISPDIFIVQDFFVPNDQSNHTYEIRWQLDSLSIVTNGSCIETADSGKPNLAIIPLRASGLLAETAESLTTPDVLGWKVLETQYPATTSRHTRYGTGVQMFITLLLPLRTGESSREFRFVEQNGMITLSTQDGREFKVYPATDVTNRLSIISAGFTDEDSDGLPDWWEKQHFGGTAGFDAQSMSSNNINTMLEAYIAGLNPTEPSAVFKVTFQPNAGAPFISWNSVTGRTYTVCWSTNLLEGFSETTMPESASNYILVPKGSNWFYKVRAGIPH